ncbi:hypothetical protein [Burkholderia cepacia]|uniref:hypothetical protein n=1 Tax=Burkholderia cepacia TaxID=292 RepID=UPI000B19F29F|nr:hypothetical protein [Burkholderia cepacia]
MNGLPQGLRQQQRSAINRFLCDLEQQSRSWSQLVPEGSGERPAGLELQVQLTDQPHVRHQQSNASSGLGEENFD